MNKKLYLQICDYMFQHMLDIGHDVFHSYRVLYHSLVISKSYETVNIDVLIASCLLHDVGRSKTHEK